MSLADIVRAMEQQALEKISAVTGAAERESEAIIAQAEADARRIREKHRAAADERLKTSRARILVDAALERRRQLAEAREAWLSRVLAGSQYQLGKLRDAPGYAEGLERLVGEALAEIGSKFKLEIAPQDEESLREIMKKFDIQGEIVPSLNNSGGLRASSLDGRIAVDNTLEARLENAWGELRPKLCELLTLQEVTCPATTVTPTRASGQ